MSGAMNEYVVEIIVALATVLGTVFAGLQLVKPQEKATFRESEVF